MPAHPDWPLPEPTYGGITPMTQGVLEHSVCRKGRLDVNHSICLFLRRRQSGRQRQDEGRAGRQRRRPGRDDQCGLPVPPGFTIQTEACREYMRGAISPESTSRCMPLWPSWKSCRARSWARATIRCWFRSFGRKVLNARHDGHDSQSGPERQGR